MKFAYHQPKHHTALTCFKNMYIERVSGLAIVDDTGKIIASLSATDFLSAPSNMELLNLPIMDYLRVTTRRVHPPPQETHPPPPQQQQKIEAGEEEEREKEKEEERIAPPLVTCKSSTVRDVMGMVTKGGVHRVWVVEWPSMKPVGSVTLSDVVSAVVPENVHVVGALEE
ncbi:hypothetical protein HK102_010475 [Quaeritorhiza haematococci]|nr:hypothetical protein HK102_010475 [Quaeritorhiza haematococci]